MLSVCLRGKCTDGGTPEVGHRGPRANARKRCRLEGQKTNYRVGEKNKKFARPASSVRRFFRDKNVRRDDAEWPLFCALNIIK